MENYIALGFGCLLFCIAVFYRETLSVREIKSFRIINLFGYMYGLTFGLLPAAVLLMYSFTGLTLSHGYYMIDYTADGLRRIFIWFLLSIVGYIVVQIVYKSAFSNQYSELCKKKLNDLDSNLIKENTSDYILEKLQLFLIICFAISCVSLHLWLKAYDGFWGLIQIADAVRDGVSNVVNPLAFFLRPGKMIMAVFFMSIILIKKKYNIGFNFIIMCVSFVLSALMLIALDGRLSMVTYLVIMALLVGEFFKIGGFSSKKFKSLAIIAVLSIIFIMNIDTLTDMLRGGYRSSSQESTSFVENLLLEFTYIITGAQKAVETCIDASGTPMIGHDILGGIFAWVPASLRPDGIINIWNHNTVLCTIGDYIYGQLPCDFITTSIYNLGWFGPLVSGIFWGIIIKFIDFMHLKKDDPFSNVLYYLLSMRIFRLVNYCLLYDFVLGVFDIFLAYVIWKACTIFTWK